MNLSFWRCALAAVICPILLASPNAWSQSSWTSFLTEIAEQRVLPPARGPAPAVIYPSNDYNSWLEYFGHQDAAVGQNPVWPALQQTWSGPFDAVELSNIANLDLASIAELDPRLSAIGFAPGAVNVHNAEFTLEETLATEGDLPLVLRYSSYARGQTVVGNGWTHSLNWRMFPSKDGDVAIIRTGWGTIVEMPWADLSAASWSYTDTSGNTWRFNEASGLLEELTTSSAPSQTYTFTWSVAEYAITGAHPRSNDRTAITMVARDYRLESVAISGGDTLYQFIYDSNGDGVEDANDDGRLTEVQDLAGVALATFFYDDFGPGRSSRGDLEAIEYQGAPKKHFSYYQETIQTQTNQLLYADPNNQWDFSLYYNSTNFEYGEAGFGWIHNFDAKLTPAVDGSGDWLLVLGAGSAQTIPASSVTVDGDDATYTESSSLVWTFDTTTNLLKQLNIDSSVPTILEFIWSAAPMPVMANLDPSVASGAQVVANEYKLQAIRVDGINALDFSYDVDGRLVGIDPADGSIADIQLEYDGTFSDGMGYLMSIESPVGETINQFYYHDGLLVDDAADEPTYKSSTTYHRLLKTYETEEGATVTNAYYNYTDSVPDIWGDSAHSPYIVPNALVSQRRTNASGGQDTLGFEYGNNSATVDRTSSSQMLPTFKFTTTNGPLSDQITNMLRVSLDLGDGVQQNALTSVTFNGNTGKIDSETLINGAVVTHGANYSELSFDDGQAHVILFDGAGGVEGLYQGVAKASYSIGDLQFLQSDLQWATPSVTTPLALENLPDILTNAAGESLVFVYNGLGLPVRVEEPGPNGSLLVHYFQYDHAGRLTQYSAPDGATTLFRYDSLNRLTARIEGSGSLEQRTIAYEYNALGDITSIRFLDPSGFVIAANYYGYDEFGRLETINWDDLGPIEGLSPSRQYEYNGAVTTIYEASSEGASRILFTETQVDSAGTQNVNGDFIDVVHHLAGLTDGVIVRLHASDRQMDRITYPLADGNNAYVHFHSVDNSGNVTVYQSIPYASATAAPASWWSVPANVAEQYTIDAEGRLLELANNRGESFVLTYNSVRQLDNVQWDAGAFVESDLDDLQTLRAAYAPVPEISLSGFERQFVDKNSGATVAELISSFTTNEDSSAHLNSLMDRAGRTIALDYDAAGRINRIEPDFVNGASKLTFNALGQLTHRISPSSFEETTINNAVGLLEKYEALVSGAFLSSEFEMMIDESARLKEVSGDDVEAIEVSVGRNRLDAIVSTAFGAELTSLYDARGFLHSETLGELELHYQFSPFGELFSLEVKDQGDASGAKIEYAYNEAGYLANVTYPDDEAVSLTYGTYVDGADTLPQVTFSAAADTFVWKYDQQGRVRYYQQTNVGQFCRFTYDEIGRLTKLEIDESDLSIANGDIARTIDYVYVGGRVSSIDDTALAGAIDYSYDDVASGGVTLAYPTGETQEFSNDLYGRLISVAFQDAQSSALSEYMYSRDVSGKPTAENYIGFGNVVFNCEWSMNDAAPASFQSELFAAVRASLPEDLIGLPFNPLTGQWSQDEWNLTTKSTLREVRDLPILEQAGYSIALGNVTEHDLSPGAASDLVYNQAGRLTEAHFGDDYYEFIYDCLGRIIERHYYSNATFQGGEAYLYIGARIFAAYEILSDQSIGAVLHQYVHAPTGVPAFGRDDEGPTRLATINDAGVAEYYQYDGWGNVRRVIGAGQALPSSQFKYALNGAPIPVPAGETELVSEQPYRWRGWAYLESVDLYYNGQSFYSPKLRRNIGEAYASRSLRMASATNPLAQLPYGMLDPFTPPEAARSQVNAFTPILDGAFTAPLDSASIPRPLSSHHANVLAAPDTDHDLIEDWAEMLLGASPSVADTDGDGLNDGLELRLALSYDNPEFQLSLTESDSDDDGLNDGFEIAYGLDPTDDDTDTAASPNGDGITYQMLHDGVDPVELRIHTAGRP
ncbi:hypothetical protein [Rubellicoccus peritrichatus]|uniref:Uncharacterized protein n=1 Tax=Rubellicoccus peritrichatus TaxID=3080537 RepID=A0AAQ3L9Z2_9BACT|nr:hypothetical protein [Puniceicoccus sp. CR14]WOO40075.1 hypothetical protein RZN69_15735 [Puniceicoccus sp. CR14]